MNENASTLRPLFSWRGAVCDSDLSPTTRHVALTLSLHMNERGGSAFPGPTLLARETGLNVSTVKERLRELERAGWLHCVSRGGMKGERKQANEYEASFPPSALFDMPSPGAVGTRCPDDPVPSPSPPGAVGTPSTSKSSSISRARANGSRIPDPFVLTDEMEAWARENAPGVNVERETQKFVLHFSAVSGNRGVMRNWTAAWKNWLLRAPDFERTR